MEDMIISVLRSSQWPLTAPEIAGKIQGADKKKINQVIYKMGAKGVEMVPDTKPPKWRLTDSAREQNPLPTGDGGATARTPLQLTVEETTKSSDEVIKDKIVQFSSLKHSPMSAPNIHRAINSQLDNCAVSDVKRVLGQLEKEGFVYNKSPKGEKPLWAWKTSSDATPKRPDKASINGKPLFTQTEMEDGRVLYTPVCKNDLDDSLETPPVPKQPSAGISSTSITSKASVGPKPVACIPPQPPTDNTDSPSQPAVVPTPTTVPLQASRKDPMANLAANFSNSMSLNEKEEEKNLDITEVELKEKIIKFFKSRPSDEESDARTVAREVGYPTRDKVLYILESLKEEGFLTTDDKKHYRVLNQ